MDNSATTRDEITECAGDLDAALIVFSGVQEYLDFAEEDAAACIILSICLPDRSGLELQRQLNEGSNTPVICVSDPCDPICIVNAMKAGAIDFFIRPFDSSALRFAIEVAFAKKRRRRQRKAELVELQQRHSRLTPRERQVLPLILGGLLNKQAASFLGISEVTLQIHRSQVTRKMQADSFADLVRMAMKLRIPYWRETPHISGEVSNSSGCSASYANKGGLPNMARAALIQTPDRQSAHW